MTHKPVVGGEHHKLNRNGTRAACNYRVMDARGRFVKALANEDTLLRTHCCGHIVADTNVSPFAPAGNICCGHKNVSYFVQKHFVSATNVSQFAQPKKHDGQQCVRNNVSSFTRTLKFDSQLKLPWKLL